MKLEISDDESLIRAILFLRYAYTNQIISLSIKGRESHHANNDEAPPLGEHGLEQLEQALTNTNAVINAVELTNIAEAVGERDCNSPRAMRLSQVVGTLSGLETFHIDAGDNDYNGAMEFLASFLREARGLKTLRCSHLLLLGFETAAICKAFADGLTGHPCLEKIEFNLCSCVNPDYATEILQAISSIPKLSYFQDDCWIVGLPVASLQLPNMDDSSNMEKVSQYEAPLPMLFNHHQNLSEVHLRLWTENDVFAARAAFRAMKTSTVLSTLVLDVIVKPPVYESLADLVVAGRSLKTFRLFQRAPSTASTGFFGRSPCKDDSPLQLLISALEGNETIKVLQLDFSGWSELLTAPVEKRLLRLAENNFALEELSITTTKGFGGTTDALEGNPKGTMMKLYTQLNRLGRKTLLRNRDAGNLWTKALAQQGDNITAIFVLLSSNPTIFSPKNKHTAEKRINPSTDSEQTL